MGFLGGKPKVSAEEFCREFYDSQVFQAIVGGVDFVPIFWDSLYKTITEGNQAYKAIDQALFKREITAIRLELFGLAWLCKFKHIKYSFPQCVFTKHYLEEKRMPDVWESMGEYNKTIAKSSTMNEKGEQIAGRAGRALIVALNSQRFGIFENYKSSVDEGDLDCIARAANRIGISIRMKDAITARCIAATLGDRLGIESKLNDEAILTLMGRMTGAILMLYNGAEEAMKSTKIR